MSQLQEFRWGERGPEWPRSDFYGRTAALTVPGGKSRGTNMADPQSPGCLAALRGEGWAPRNPIQGLWERSSSCSEMGIVMRPPGLQGDLDRLVDLSLGSVLTLGPGCQGSLQPEPGGFKAMLGLWLPGHAVTSCWKWLCPLHAVCSGNLCSAPKPVGATS
jgi:hypothetical protein